MFKVFALPGNRETAFIYAINAAASVYQLVDDCNEGRIGDCCKYFKPKLDNETAEPCDYVTYAKDMSREFLHAQENISLYVDDRNIFRRVEKGMMNIYNYEVGRLVSIGHAGCR